jgi:deoxyribonuclease-4
MRLSAIVYENQWVATEIDPEHASRFRAALVEFNVRHPIAHNSYLINLASPDETLWRKSVDALTVELRRAEILGIPYLITHPGSYTTSSESRGLRRIIRALDLVHRRTRDLRARCLLETTAGQGTCLGCRFEHLATILDGVRDPERLGVCFDTCHVFAAGYPLTTLRQYRATMRQLDRLVGLERIKAFHLNDSRRECGSRVDRHAHIGRGAMGLEPFRHLLADPRFREIPMYLETPKGQEEGIDLDVINLTTLRSLLDASGFSGGQ